MQQRGNGEAAAQWPGSHQPSRPEDLLQAVKVFSTRRVQLRISMATHTFAHRRTGIRPPTRSNSLRRKCLSVVRSVTSDLVISKLHAKPENASLVALVAVPSGINSLWHKTRIGRVSLPSTQTVFF